MFCSNLFAAPEWQTGITSPFSNSSAACVVTDYNGPLTKAASNTVGATKNYHDPVDSPLCRSQSSASSVRAEGGLFPEQTRTHYDSCDSDDEPRSFANRRMCDRVYIITLLSCC
jgi:hypothetical protein